MSETSHDELAGLTQRFDQLERQNLIQKRWLVVLALVTVCTTCLVLLPIVKPQPLRVSKLQVVGDAGKTAIELEGMRGKAGGTLRMMDSSGESVVFLMADDNLVALSLKQSRGIGRTHFSVSDGLSTMSVQDSTGSAVDLTMSHSHGHFEYFNNYQKKVR